MKYRGRLAAAVVAALSLTLLAACGGGSSSTTETTKVNFGILQIKDFINAMPSFVAQDQGYFTDAGLEVTIVDFTAGSDLTKAMAGGSVDIAEATGLDVVSGAAHDVGVKAFFGTYQKSPMALIVGPNSTITGWKDLAGKKVGISAAGSLTDYITRACLTAVGVDPSSVTEVPLGAPSSVMAALDSGDIDAFVLPTFFGILEQAQGKGKTAQTAADVLGNNSQFGILMGTTSFLSDNPNTSKAFGEAIGKAITYMQNNKDATIAIAMDKLGLPEPVATATYEEYIANFTPDGGLNADGLAAYAQALPTLGLATDVPSADSYTNTDIMK